MNRVKQLFQGFGLILVASLLISCGALSVSFVDPTATPTAELPTPTSTPKPPAPTPTPTDSEIPEWTSDVPRISAEDLKVRLDNGEAILIVDARDNHDFKIQHIAGAVSVPKREIESRLDEFPRDQEIVLYCA